ncbi:unnamed protein product [Adineta steineri]|uniref:Uncharacterized protein n=1 Tax=Adineta steineri TaxID=433720 RepID=A0A818QHW9_9BILA|nr:unnamed protein product [Adineta steineri]CAF1121235.1 unnamed protein product [Adineta steineri]CAF3641075.1 unnamed protein product [Adineta steineri]CAF3853527.1 unnamed protein product [Adineta steineri]
MIIQQNSSPSFKWIWRIVGFVWAFLTGCFAIINIFVFVQPQWIGDTLASPRAGHFGLYSYCVSTISDYDFDCQGTWTNFGTILNAPFAVATFFVGFSALLILICLGLFILFLFINARLVYFICALIQIICAICLLIALIIYPSGFDNEIIRSVCGSNVNDFYIDTCQVRWAYILAIIAFFNILILAILAFLLGMKQPNIETEKEAINPKYVASKYGELNEAFEDRTYSEQRR